MSGTERVDEILRIIDEVLEAQEDERPASRLDDQEAAAA